MWRTLFNITLTLTLTTGLGLELTTGLGLEFKIYRSIFLQCLFGYLMYTVRNKNEVLISLK